jgi:hypothetical protein
MTVSILAFLVRAKDDLGSSQAVLSEAAPVWVRDGPVHGTEARVVPHRRRTADHTDRKGAEFTLAERAAGAVALTVSSVAGPVQRPRHELPEENR